MDILYDLPRFLNPEVHENPFEQTGQGGITGRNPDAVRVVSCPAGGTPGLFIYRRYFPAAPQVFIDEAELKQLQLAPGHIFLLTFQSDAPCYEHLAVPAPLNAVAASGGKTPLTNQPLAVAAGVQ